MKKFPSELEGILNAKGRRVLSGKHAVDTSVFRPGASGFLSLPDLIDESMNDKIHRILETNFDRYMKRKLIKLPTSPAQMKKFRENNWFLPIWNTGFLYLDEENRKEATELHIELAESLNLIPMLESDSYREFVKVVTGLGEYLEAEGQPIQLGAYRHGSYVGPHNDYYGTARKPEYFIDVHFSFNNKYVKHMYLMYQLGDLMSGMTELHTKGGIGVYRLPMWHQSTPLQGVKGREDKAKRWLIMTAVDLKSSYGR